MTEHKYRRWSGQVVTVEIHRTVGPFALVSWGVRESLEGYPPFTYYRKARWVPRWRLLDTPTQHVPTEKEEET